MCIWKIINGVAVFSVYMNEFSSIEYTALTFHMFLTFSTKTRLRNEAKIHIYSNSWNSSAICIMDRSYGPSAEGEDQYIV